MLIAVRVGRLSAQVLAMFVYLYLIPAVPTPDTNGVEVIELKGSLGALHVQPTSRAQVRDVRVGKALRELRDAWLVAVMAWHGGCQGLMILPLEGVRAVVQLMAISGVPGGQATVGSEHGGTNSRPGGIQCLGSWSVLVEARWTFPHGALRAVWTAYLQTAEIGLKLDQ